MHSIIKLGLAAAALALAVPAAAQTAPDMKIFTASAEVQALIAKAKATIKPGEPTLSQPLLSLAPYKANLEYRVAKGPAAVHETEAELFYVIEGSGTVVTGGHLTGEKRTNEHNLSGDGIADGQTRKVAKGDLFIVPQNTPHQVTQADGALVVMTFHVPRS